MNEDEIRACGGEFVDAVKPRFLANFKDEDVGDAERMFSTGAALFLQFLVDVNRTASAIERMGSATGDASSEKTSQTSIYDSPDWTADLMVLR